MLLLNVELNFELLECMQYMNVWVLRNDGMNTVQSFYMQAERICSSAASHAEES